MIKSVARYHHWAPSEIDGLYFDSADHLGLEYWYEDCVEVDGAIKRKAKEQKNGK